MRIRAERDDLGDVFARANRAVGARAALPVLQGLLCEVTGSTLRVTGTDLEMTVRTQCDVEVMEEGRALIPGKLLENAVRRMPSGPVTISAGDTDVEILGRGPRFSVRPLSIDDYPTLDDSTIEGTDVDGDALASAIGQVTVAASTDAARPILTGVLFETTDQGVRLVATDSYRLAVKDLPGVGLSGQGLIPARGLRELPRTVGASKVSVGIDTREGVFASDRGSLRLRMIEGTFPKYQSLLPDSYPNEIVVDKEGLLEALNRVALVAEDHIPVRLTLQDGGIEIAVTRQDVGGETEHLPGEYSGAEASVLIAFNPRYLADGVGAIAGDEVRIRVIDGLKPSVIDSKDDPEFLYLLMPVRI
ncbi:MAG: DNA polymerase III subunit beta [Acidimicrobiia bacterium]|nr:DNA polymerase III subunit beta [Acidimicrobiia bacterium]